ncbi:MAG: phosphate/phosphite/phosphonate ABC transporter substrate-binding protein [Desulfobulbaceae bacterium]|nr:phosphate/phosphite/phosphonate ABC transporter substrate-binding protein [Desulfobulbaceae bacterium]
MKLRKHQTSFTFGTCLLGLTLLLATAFTPQAGAETLRNGSKIRIAILPCTDIAKAFTNYQPLRNYLQLRLQREVEILVPSTFQEFKRIIKFGEAEFAFQAPHAYLMMANQYKKNNLLETLTPEGTSTHRGVFITRRDSEIENIDDLRDKNIIFGHLYSTAKWMAAKTVLANNGIDIEKDLRDYSHGDSCESIAMKVYLKQADAGVICDYSYNEITANTEPRDDEIPPDGLKIVGFTWEIPTWVFSAQKDIDPQTVTQVYNVLLQLDHDKPKHLEILNNMEISGFAHATDSAYDQLRKNLNPTGSIPQ